MFWPDSDNAAAGIGVVTDHGHALSASAALAEGNTV